MAYKKNTWEVGDLITAEKMNSLEDNLAAVSSNFDDIITPINFTENYNLSNEGELIQDENCSVSELIPYVYNTTFGDKANFYWFCTDETEEELSYKIVFYDNQQNYLDHITTTSSGRITVAQNQNASYIRFSFKKDFESRITDYNEAIIYWVAKVEIHYGLTNGFTKIQNEKQLLSDNIKGALIDCIRNTAFINTRGQEVFSNFCHSLNIEKWLDICPRISINQDGTLASFSGTQRCTSALIDVSDFVSLQCNFLDDIEPNVFCAIYCYDTNGNPILIDSSARATPSGAYPGMKERTFLTGTKKIRFLFTGSVTIENICNKYTGRILHIYLKNSQGQVTEQNWCLTKTEDGNNVM